MLTSLHASCPNLYCRVIKRLITILSQYASLSSNYDAVLTQANNANAELTRRIESEDKKVQYYAFSYGTINRKIDRVTNKPFVLNQNMRNCKQV